MLTLRYILGFPGNSDGKESACNERELGSIPGSGRYSGEGNGNPFQYSCLGNPMDRGAWQGCKESDMTERLTLSLSQRGNSGNGVFHGQRSLATGYIPRGHKELDMNK